VKGFVKYFWEKVRARNEPLDCRVLARAALASLGADRWSDEQWEERAARAVGPAVAAAPAPTPRPRPSAATAPIPSPERARPVQTVQRRRGGWM
jgi:phage terminase large subunit GpA-like protein